MQLRTLEVFCAVADQRSFSKAAAAFDLTQSAVSQAIGQLEESLGTRLIDRGKRPLVLTPAGQTYHRGLVGILRNYQQLERQVRGQASVLEGVVRVGTIYSVGLSYMPQATTAFAQLHGGVQVRLEYGSSERVVEMVGEGRVDFGLVSFPRSTKHLGHVVWQNEPMRLVCAAGHPLADRSEVSAEDLRGIEMIGFDRSLRLRLEIDRQLARLGVVVHTETVFDNADSIVRAIQATRGIGIVPEAVVRRETAAGALRVIAWPSFQMVRPLGIIFRRGGELPAAAMEFASLLLGRPLTLQKRSRAAAARRDPKPESTRATSVVA